LVDCGIYRQTGKILIVAKSKNHKLRSNLQSPRFLTSASMKQINVFPVCLAGSWLVILPAWHTKILDLGGNLEIGKSDKLRVTEDIFYTQPKQGWS
jgi:hypothetical protein